MRFLRAIIFLCLMFVLQRTAAFGAVIEPLKSKAEIQAVITAVHASLGSESPFQGDKAVVLRVTPRGEFVLTQYGFELYRIFKTDLNNDGEEKFVVVSIGGAMRLLGLVGVFRIEGGKAKMIFIPAFEGLFDQGTSEIDEKMKELIISGKAGIRESHQALAMKGEILSDADIGFQEEKGKIHVMCKRIHGKFLEADDSTPYWHRTEGASAEFLDYLIAENEGLRLVRKTAGVYLGMEPLFYYQKCFNLPSVSDVPGVMDAMNKEYQAHVAHLYEAESKTPS